MVRMNVGSQVSSQAPDGTREGLRLKGRPELVTDKNQVREEAGNPTHGPTVGRQREKRASLFSSVSSGTGTSPSLNGLCFLTVQQCFRQHASLSARKERLAFQFLHLVHHQRPLSSIPAHDPNPQPTPDPCAEAALCLS